MKANIKFSILLLAALMMVGISSCEKEDFLIFTTTTNDTLSFSNEFQPVYKLSNATSSNVAERLVWNKPDFGTPSTVTYVVEVSATDDFATVLLSSGDTSNIHYGLGVSALIQIAVALGLDEDPSTNNDDGTPNTTATLYARVKAFVGGSSDGANASMIVSSGATMNIEMLEVAAACSEAELSTWGLVGSAVNDWGGQNRGFAAGNDVPFLSNGTEGNYTSALYLSDGEFKIRQDNDWGVNYGDTGADGNLVLAGDNITITAGNYYVDFNATDLTITITPADSVWGIVGSATLNGWGDAPDVKMIPDPCNDGVYLVYGVVLTDGEMKFRADDDWGNNIGGADGTTVSSGANITVTAGTYNITLDTVNSTYSIVAQ